jgi:hypothetical protein
MKHLIIALRRWPLWLAALGWLLAGCGAGGDSADTSGAARTIEAYLQARVDENVEQMTLLSCPEWEAQARLEAVSFQSMEATLDGVTCEAGGSQGDNVLVNCAGKITTTYQGEVREWSVAEHPYVVVQQDGEWRMCGYGE